MTIPLLSSSTALFLDLDGTLAPIQDDPDTVQLPAGGWQMLLRISDQLDRAIAIVSGRDVRDLAKRVPTELWRAGGHGAHVCRPGDQPPQTLPDAPAEMIAAISSLVEYLPGVRLEMKGPVIAVHYRKAPEQAIYLESEVSMILKSYVDYELQSGKMVIEARPVSAHKGNCIRALMKEPPFLGRLPIMVGDDRTDEDAMLASLELGGTAIKVGSGPTAAPFSLSDPQAVWDWLKKGLK